MPASSSSCRLTLGKRTLGTKRQPYDAANPENDFCKGRAMRGGLFHVLYRREQFNKSSIGILIHRVRDGNYSCFAGDFAGPLRKDLDA